MTEREEGKLEGKRELLVYLMGVAQATQGAEVWRALFAEQLWAIEAINLTPALLGRTVSSMLG